MITLKQVTWPEYRTYLALVGKKELTLNISELFNTRTSNVVEKNPYDSDDIFYVLFDGKSPVGFANINIGDVIWIGDFQIIQSRKGQGLGTEFFNRLKKEYPGKVFQCNYIGMMARHFWLRQGFVNVGTSTPKQITRLLEYDPTKKQ